MKSNLTLLFGLLLFSTLHAQVPAYVPTDGLVGWWPFNGNANDESGNGNDGVVNGATLTEDRFGNANAAFNFLNNDTSLSEIILDEVPALSNQDWSISFWINTSNSLRQGIITLGNDNVTRDCIQIFSFEQLRYNLHNVPGPFTSGGIADANWHHVTVMNFDGNGHLYFDGVFQGSTLGMNPNIGVSGTRRFGGARNIDGNIWRMNGSLDDIAIWNRALTPAEVHELYTGQPVTPPVTCTALPSNLQTGLVGYWPFCGNSNDESGNGNDGVVNGATLTEDRFGNANAAYGFDGNQQYIDVLDDSSLRLDNSDYTISVWVKFNQFVSQDLLSKRGVASGYGLTTGNGDNFNVWHFDTNSGTLATLSLNEWLNVTCVYSVASNELTAYVNNEEVGSAIMPLIASGTGELRFGGDPLYDVYWHNGLLDDIAIWNRALTPEEVQELYTGIAPNPEPCVALPANLQEGIVGYWPFCGNANDESGNGNNGTVL